MTGGSLSYQFKTASVVVKLIVINAVVFIGVNIVAFLMQMEPSYLTRWFVLPDSISEVIWQPWSFFSYSFLHSGIFHILFNMIFLYMFGRIILNLFSEKRFLAIYLLGALAGGLLFVLSYNIFPAFASSKGYLLGASGAVTAIMVFIATYTPNTVVRIFMFNLKIWWIAVFFVLKDLIQLPLSDNAGGLLTHLGGAIFGYVYARQMAKGNDIGAWFERFMDWVADLFKTRKQKPFKKVHRNKATQSKTKRSKPVDSKSDHQKKVDAILDKISKSGYESLTKAEKDFLFKAGNDN
ncbi:rhomboid family intramembrane serine protease [Aureisphaera galaxeae]|uniref:rhomboid family intramembrane serine protease n=1 Tax=Aureisphaera galaxeae TaxID=1538023 RepID=UPI00235029C6|nr:rhomboid family intramembrane serine protease [Aureisphaera galaxeae]MDC8003484.1 rhomboid family intramembrane serine protease [Aureisphaera galaxeae]